MYRRHSRGKNILLVTKIDTILGGIVEKRKGDSKLVVEVKGFI